MLLQQQEKHKIRTKIQTKIWTVFSAKSLWFLDKEDASNGKAQDKMKTTKKNNISDQNFVNFLRQRSPEKGDGRSKDALNNGKL